MFKQAIQSTPFTTDAANSYFTNIVGESVHGDQSFLATLRALVAPRLPEEDSICVVFRSCSYSSGDVSRIAANEMVKIICGGIDFSARGNLHVQFFTSSEENNLACLTLLERKMTEVYPDLIRLENVTLFYQKAFRVLCFVAPERKATYVFVDRLDIRKLHYLQCSVLAMLPWYFDQQTGVTEKEMELIKSLRETTSDHYIQVLSDLAAQYDFDTARIRRLLAGFETKFEKIELEQVKRDVEYIDNEIDRFHRAINEKLTQRNDRLIRMMGLEAKINQPNAEDSEIMEYFLCNKRLYLENVSDNAVFFSAKDYVLYFDKDIAERVIANKSSNAYNYIGRSMTKDQAEKLLREIFLSDPPPPSDQNLCRVPACAGRRRDGPQWAPLRSVF